MERTVADVPLRKNEHFVSARGFHEEEVETHEISRGAEVHGICIALVLFFEEGCEGPS